MNIKVIHKEISTTEEIEKFIDYWHQRGWTFVTVDSNTFYFRYRFAY